MFVKRIKSKATIQEARERDGVCLWGLIAQDGCVGGFDVHHIETKGSGGDDILDNLICLCRKHHNEAHNVRITKEQLKGLLRQFYGIQRSSK